MNDDNPFQPKDWRAGCVYWSLVVGAVLSIWLAMMYSLAKK